MIIEFELQGSRCLHKGVFETTGFWARFEEEAEVINGVKNVDGYKIVSHFSFSYYHENKTIADEVYHCLVAAITTPAPESKILRIKIENVGFINKYDK